MEFVNGWDCLRVAQQDRVKDDNSFGGVYIEFVVWVYDWLDTTTLNADNNNMKTLMFKHAHIIKLYLQTLKSI